MLRCGSVVLPMKMLSCLLDYRDIEVVLQLCDDFFYYYFLSPIPQWFRSSSKSAIIVANTVFWGIY